MQKGRDDMAYQKKYKQGKVITSIEELSKQEFIYYREHIYHRGWFCSWQFGRIIDYMKSGNIRYAIKERQG